MGFEQGSFPAQAARCEWEAFRRAYVMRRENDSVRNLLWFFYELDRRSLPPRFLHGWEHRTPFENHRVEVIGRMVSYLNSRVVARAEGSSVPNDSARSDDLNELAWLQRPLYESCIRRSTDPDAARYAYAKAFVYFGGGHLYVPEQLNGWNIGPNSHQYALFAEFSLACIDHSIDPHFWRLPLPAHVLSQSVYIRAFPDGAGPPLRIEQLEEEAERVALECAADPSHSSLVDAHNQFVHEIVRDSPDAFMS